MMQHGRDKNAERQASQGVDKNCYLMSRTRYNKDKQCCIGEGTWQKQLTGRPNFGMR